MSVYPFVVDKQYNRRDVYELLSVPAERRRGNWETGYNRWGEDLYIFCNVGAAGRSGHDYDNRWVDDRFQWWAKEGTHLRQKMIQWMLHPTGNILLFAREDNRSPFTFHGYAQAIDHAPTSPVKIIWRLHHEPLFNPSALPALIAESPILISSDFAPPETERVEVTTFRILRDTALARRIKALHRNNCQICGLAIELPDGSSYSEAHHIQPLGMPHNGPDVEGNIIVLCPNHHAMCDYGAIRLVFSEFRQHPAHVIRPQFFDYHNTSIYIASVTLIEVKR